MKASINIPLALALGALLVACGGGGSTTTSSGDNDSGTTGTANTTTTTTTTAGGSIAPAITAPDGSRLLASQCFQCHGMNGVSASGIDSIAGESAASLVEEMLEMKYSTEIDIMHYQAKGYSEDEIRSMAVYIAALPRSANGDND
ncbi:c-type cytochrome [Thiothrix winogradskyi]|uniref:Cytochrome c class I n=1 Tax=Thiothrix winogradskyi TaxID=96472 RepID=A0ABY3T440_9GAMM|nr:cytochrome c class I [Thiothrix winogradskyi]UJS25700.1 cytochrome c class I [Thiothrix winogradskyi]